PRGWDGLVAARGRFRATAGAAALRGGGVARRWREARLRRRAGSFPGGCCGRLHPGGRLPGLRAALRRTIRHDGSVSARSAALKPSPSVVGMFPPMMTRRLLAAVVVLTAL